MRRRGEIYTSEADLLRRHGFKASIQSWADWYLIPKSNSINYPGIARIRIEDKRKNHTYRQWAVYVETSGKKPLKGRLKGGKGDKVLFETLPEAVKYAISFR